MRWLGWTNPPWVPSGYGIQFREISKRLIEAGHHVAVAANYGLGGSKLQIGGVTVYPFHQGPENVDMIATYAADFAADVVLSLYDIWALPQNTRQLFKQPWIALTPIDGSPLNDPQVWHLKAADYPVAYSQFGVAEMRKAGIQPDYIPHGIDCDVFKPGDKTAARKALCLAEDAFVVSIVAANKGYPARKAWPEALAGFKAFHDKHPEALLYCHTTKEPFASAGEGIYFDVLYRHLNIPESAIAFPDQQQLALNPSDDLIAEIYRASDVMLLPSMGEGFGLPVIEAQACGCPVITQACSAMTELTANGIALEPLQPFWVSPLRYDWQVPSIRRITQALEVIHSLSDDERESNATMGVDFIRANYSWPVVWTQHWEPFIEKVEDELW